MLALLSTCIAGNYYAYDSIAPVADLLRSGRGFTVPSLKNLAFILFRKPAHVQGNQIARERIAVTFFVS